MNVYVVINWQGEIVDIFDNDASARTIAQENGGHVEIWPVNELKNL